jgi:transposase
MDVSSKQPKITAGLDLGDNYTYLCLIDTESGEVMEEGRLRTTPEAFRRRFESERPIRVAIEAGTHSPWTSRLLEQCGHEVLVANAHKVRLIYGGNNKADKLDAENLGLVWRDWIPNSCRHASTGVKTPKLIWHSSAPGRR